MTYQQAQSFARILPAYQFKSLILANNGDYIGSTSIEDINGFTDGVPSYLPSIVTSLDSSFIGTSPWFALNWQGSIRDPKHVLDLSEVKVPYDKKQAQSFYYQWGGYPLLGVIPIGPIPVTASNIDILNSLMGSNLLAFLGKDKSFMYTTNITQVTSQGSTFPYTFPITPASSAPTPQLLRVGIFSSAFAYFNPSYSPSGAGGAVSDTKWGLGKDWGIFLNSIQATETNFTNCTQGEGYGIAVFSQDILNSVIWNGYCSKTMEEAGYGAGDLVPITFNAIGNGSGVYNLLNPVPELGIGAYNPNQWCATVGTVNEAGTGYAWTAGTTYDSIPKNYIPYDIWSQGGGGLINEMVNAGVLLIWNKTVSEPSVKLSDLTPQSKAWTNNGQTVSLPVLPSTSAAKSTTAASSATKSTTASK